MPNYKCIFDNKPSDDDLTEIRNILQSEVPFSDWENYYWGAKCLCVFDTENFDAKLSIKAMNAAIKYGLTYRVNKALYLDAIKVLATLNSQIGRHDVVLNYLNSLIELDPSVPDWVYHDFALAEIHTDNIKRILRRPAMFLSDLGRNDSNSEAVRKKQKNIFKEFLIEAVRFLKENSDCEVALPMFEQEAIKYSLTESDGWKAFAQATSGVFLDVISPIVTLHTNEKSLSSAMATPAEQSEDGRPLIVSLFPEDEIHTSQQSVADPELGRKYSDVLARLETTEAELEQKRIELEGKERSLEDLNEQNKKLQKTAQSGMATQQGLQKQITDVEAENEALKTEIEKLKKATREAFEQVKSDSKADIIGHIHIYQHSTQIALTKWLNRYLPMCSAKWFEDCVLDSLSYEQRERAHEEKYTSLEQFDLAALLRITKKCWSRLKSNTGMYLAQSDYDCLQKMWELRNRWAHPKTELPELSDIKEDLYTIAEFMTQMHCSKESVKEVNDYARQIGRMS